MMMDHAYQLLLGGVVTFVAVFLKGFQQKNVNGNHYRLVFITSYLMAFSDIATIGLIIKNGWSMAIPAGTGAALGMMVAMHLHKKFVSKDKEG